MRQLGEPGPPFTSYPAAARFTHAFGPDQYRQALRQRAEGAVVGGVKPLSLALNFPHCAPLDPDCSRDLVHLLVREVELHRLELGATQAVSQLHLGVASPTALGDEELSDLMRVLRGAFRILAGAELSIDVDPQTASLQRLRHLVSLGFSRVSFGVQDFDPVVQAAAHRQQSYESLTELVAEARALRFESINADLFIGLPQQTPESFRRTVTQMAALHPSRITLHSQTRPLRHSLDSKALSSSGQYGQCGQLGQLGQLRQMRADAFAGFTRQGYVHLGMDHFALPTDALAVAKRLGRLRRNFQGYTTQPEGDQIALGVSAIGRMGANYSQNAMTLPGYRQALAQGLFPVVRGLALSRDDLLRRSVIMAILCQGRVEFEAIELAHLVKVPAVFAAELQRLQTFEALGLVHVNAQEIQVTDKGWFCIRAIARVFDRYLPPTDPREHLSRVV